MDYSEYTLPVEGLKKNQIEEVLTEYLRKYIPSHLIQPQKLDVEHLLTVSLSLSHNFCIEIVKSLDDNSEGEMWPFQRVIKFPRKIYSGIVKNKARARFTGCHEAVHAILHEQQLTQNYKTILRLSLSEDKPIYKNPEWQADYGAGVLLMPKTTIIPFIGNLKALGKTYDEIIEEIMNIYGVSRKAAETRYSKITL